MCSFPSAEASAQVMRLEANTTTLAAEYAKLGLDWEAALEQRAREYKKLALLGLPLPVPAMPQPVDPNANSKQGKAPAGDYPGAQIEDAVS
jgi:capsid protein